MPPCCKILKQYRVDEISGLLLVITEYSSMSTHETWWATVWIFLYNLATSLDNGNWCGWH
jgi:hypothetical protein